MSFSRAARELNLCPQCYVIFQDHRKQLCQYRGGFYALDKRMEEEEGPYTRQRAQLMHGQGREEDTLTNKRAPTACSQGTEEGGETPLSSSVQP